MRTSVTVALASTAASLVAAAPFSFPLSNGFPNLNTTAMAEVYKLAGGTLPNGVLPTSLKPDAVQTLQLIAANELFEVAYFTELLYNVTSGVPGYQVENYDYVVSTLTAVINVSLLFLYRPFKTNRPHSKNRFMSSLQTVSSPMQRMRLFNPANTPSQSQTLTPPSRSLRHSQKSCLVFSMAHNPPLLLTEVMPPALYLSSAPSSLRSVNKMDTTALCRRRSLHLLHF